MTYMIFTIHPTSEDQAEAAVNECPGYGQGGQRCTYYLLRKNGRWIVTKEERGPIL